MPIEFQTFMQIINTLVYPAIAIILAAVLISAYEVLCD